ncbi:MAG: GIY-YIG nuclease family protein [Bacteroidota bacterium]|jgi:hypothetical protein
MQTLISGYLERISSKVFDDYHREITKLIGDQHGVYALYKKNHLYYVGLATNLRLRVKQHLRDRHSKKWDTFSLYLIQSVQHLKELESLVIRIAEPKGNLTRGKFGASTNLQKELKQAMHARSDRQIENILSGQRRGKKVQRRTSRRRSTLKAGKGKRTPSLQGLLSEGSRLRVVYKKQDFDATLDATGRIIFEGKIFNSPSSAGSAIIGKPIDGWHFWKYENAQGQWVKIDELRKK